MDSAPSGSFDVATDAQAAQSTGSHRRTYQACIPCRKRKVRCDLGPVDDPHEPPCQRCRRESKECYFSATRRKRRLSDGEEESRDEGETEPTASYKVRRKSARSSAPFHGDPADSTEPTHAFSPGSAPGRSPGDAMGFPRGVSQSANPRYHARQNVRRSEDGQDQEVANETAAALFQSPINSPGDALHLLLQASGQSENIQDHRPLDGSDPRSSSKGANHSAATSNLRSADSKPMQFSVPRSNASAIDPAISGLGRRQDALSADKETLATWSRLRFVRSGWFTAKEAVAYIDYFYHYLAPLTPVSPPDLREVNRNPNILSEEPMLVMTLLTIASRYVRLAGPGGQTRSYMIHERLWVCLQNMITRMFWAQEQYGGGYSISASRRRGSDKVGSLRTLGTIESLLLLSDFHPRSMHFPPTGDDEEIMAPSAESPKDNSFVPNEGSETPTGGGSTLSGWTEPALRSDRMTWSLIGLSHALALELGIFGTYTDDSRAVSGGLRRQREPSEKLSRADRIERLLYFYITQACGRFGFPSFYSEQVNKLNFSIAEDGYSPVVSSPANNETSEDQIQGYWVEMAAINKACNDALFPSKAQTASFIQSGEYIQRLQQLQPIIKQWHDKISSSTVAKFPKLTLLIDLHYFRLYMNGLALQAVLEQWATKVGEGRQPDSPETPGSTLSSHFASLYSRNEPYIKEVIDASRTILRHVVFDFLPNDFLKHAPVRMYFRIVSAAMFLLKTFALGGRLNEVRTSLQLLEETIKALRTSVVDDVHLCLRIADLLERLTSSIGNKFVRLPPQATNSPQGAKAQPGAYQDRLPDFPTASAHHPDGTSSTSFANFDQPFDFTANPLSGIPHTHTDPNDASIAIMPPPAGSYTNFDFGSTPAGAQAQGLEETAALTQDPQNSLSAAGGNYAIDGTAAAATTTGGGRNLNFPFPSEEDWLTLDLQPLFDASGGFGSNNNNNDSGGAGSGGGGGDNTTTGGLGSGGGGFDTTQQWYGAFGPETHNNLEVLGKLVNNDNDPWQPGDLGF